MASGIGSKTAFISERASIRKWLHTMLLKGTFGASADTVLAAIRRAFIGDEFGNPFVKPELQNFPVDAISDILKSHGKDPQITDEFINSLLYTQYEDRQAFIILSLLAPNLDYRNGDFNKDHLHPSSLFKRKAKLVAAGIPEGDIDFYRDAKNWNSILNLRHLDASENKSKQDRELAAWVAQEASRQKVTEVKFCLDHELPEPSLLTLSDFRKFIEERRRILSHFLRTILG